MSGPGPGPAGGRGCVACGQAGYPGAVGERGTPPWPIRWPPPDPVRIGPGVRLGRPALTLIELVIIVAIVLTAAGIAIPAYMRSREKERILQAVSDIVGLDHDIAIDESTRGEPPPSLAAIGRAGLLDPWGRPYVYQTTAAAGVGQDRRDRLFKPLNTDYDLYSRGRDGQTQQRLDHPESVDDVVRALNGAYIGLAADF